MSEPAEPARPNMTPMIDVVFQLLVFFLVSMKFKTLDMKMEARLPDEGFAREPRPPRRDPTIDVRLRRAAHGAPTVVRVGNLTFGDAADDATWQRLHEHVAGVRRRAGDAADAVRGEIDAAPAVAAEQVVRAIDTLRGGGVADVRFTGTAPPR